MQVTVAFLPHSVGDSSSELAVHYDTGECLANKHLLVHVRVDVMHSYFFSSAIHVYIQVRLCTVSCVEALWM